MSSRWLLFSSLLLASCTDLREKAERTLQETGAEVLREEAAFLYKERFGGSGTEFSVVDRSAWPPTFRRFKPRRVGAYPDGFSLALATDADTERGLFVIPQYLDLQTPRWAAEATFEPLAEGVFWYAFTRSPGGGDLQPGERR